VRKEAEVNYVIAERSYNLTNMLKRIGAGENVMPVPHSRGDELKGGGTGPNPHGLKEPTSDDISVGDNLAPAIQVRSRDFR
jgi:error-prone DNA polymerase